MIELSVSAFSNILINMESLSAQAVDEHVCSQDKIQVYPHVATGFSDTSAFLRELTLKSMLVLALKLSQRTLSGSLLKHLSRFQVNEEPAIRKMLKRRDKKKSVD